MIPKKIFYIGNDDDFYRNLVSSLAALQQTNNTQFKDENLGSVECTEQKPDIAIFECDTPNALKHAEDVFSYKAKETKVFFRGVLAPNTDNFYKTYCLAMFPNEREDVRVNHEMKITLAQLGLLS